MHQSYKYFFYFSFVFLALVVACRPDQSVVSSGYSKSSVQKKDGKILINDIQNLTEKKIEREDWQRPEYVVSKLGDLSNKTVVEIGPGYGFWLVYLVQEANKVIGVDIDIDAVKWLEHIKLFYAKEQQKKIDIRHVTPEDPMLEPNEVDAVLIVNTVAYIEDKVAYFQKLREAITKDGVIVIVDYKMRDLEINIAPPKSERISLADLETEMKNAGLQIIQADDKSLDHQYILIAIDPD
jgi:cyclopropane fatty-acyl-phospholipid synthase-like methyltransferase